ncbi:UNVERIFIED_CONTAM: hypothetical protein PYX00_008468 [Menopon gallinae]|uniref:protein-tyrosine-phosphatase n=1 Tax=Menopon gallinae TaxID=328185 RepID=A0AAW2HNP0_9NEOP
MVLALLILVWGGGLINVDCTSFKTDSLQPDPFISEDPTSQAVVVLRKDLFSNSEDIHYYAILVAARNAIEAPSSGSWNCDSWPDLRKWEEAISQNGTVLTYQTTPVKWKPFQDSSAVSYTIGTGECDDHNYCNMPLEEKYKYALKVRAFTLETYQDTDIVYFETFKRLPVSFISLVLGGIFLSGAIAVALSMIHYDGFHIPRLSSSARLTPNTKVLFKSFTSAKFKKHAAALLQVAGRLSNEFHLLGTLSSNLTTLCLHGQRVDNRCKNRYGDILPFDVTRVVLSILNGDPSTDYINASFIKGYSQEVEYIAAQGPKKETCHDFYRMIIEQKIELIIMLTDLEENGIELCYKYFPDVGLSLTFGDIQVYCKSENVGEFWTERKIMVKCDSAEFEVIQLHFENWLDFGCPRNIDGVIKLCEYARQIPRGGCMLVHGTAGAGRSGTYIAIDILLQAIQHCDKISVFATVLELRRQRVNMVQTVDQYAFIYKSMIEALGKSKV